MTMDAKERIRQLSETKKLVLRKLLENKDIGGDRLLSLEASNVKMLRSGSPILFIFPATEGSVSYMSSYLPYIPSSFGVCGCQTPGLDGEQRPYRTVAAIAEHAIRQIQRMAPKGPYYLAGNCMGGLPAYEAARQLQAMGQEVALVLHLMPIFNRRWREMPGLTSLQMRGFVDYTFIIERLLGVKMNLPWGRLAELDEDAQVDFMVEYIRENQWLCDLDLEAFRKRIEVYKANLEAMLSYEPEDDFQGTLKTIAVGDRSRGEADIPIESPYAAVLRRLPRDRVELDYVDAEGGALFDGAEPHMTKIGAAMRRALTPAGG
jgi:thioesterase domain-containing protein